MVEITVIIAIIVFGIIVLVHEFGHFIVAKKNGILVEEFAIGMGPKLVGVKKGETFYSIRILPLGGYCKMLGEDDKSNDERAFGNKSVSARISVIAAGPFMNFLLAFVILLVLTVYLGFFYSTTIDEVVDGYPAQEMGMKSGDRVIKVNETRIHTWEELSIMISESNGEEINFIVKREDQKLNINIKPMLEEQDNLWKIGIVPAKEKDNILGMINHSFWKMILFVKLTISGFVKLVTGQVQGNQIAGPIGIVSMIGENYKQGLRVSIIAAIVNVSQMIVLLSANLGVLNLFPIPALDGSRLVFLMVEAIRKKPIDAKVEGTIHLVGFALLMLLMVFVGYNDIVNLFAKYFSN